MKDELILKNNLKQHRENKGLSQEELAVLVGTTRQTIIAVEKGKFNPSAKLALLLTAALDVKFVDLFYFLSKEKKCFNLKMLTML